MEQIQLARKVWISLLSAIGAHLARACFGGTTGMLSAMQGVLRSIGITMIYVSHHRQYSE